MSHSQAQLKVRRSVRILDKQITRRSPKASCAESYKVKMSKSSSAKQFSKIPSFQDIVSQVSHSNQEYFSQLMLALKFAKDLRPVDHSQLVSKAVHLRRRPMYEHAKTLIFDLDETLVHCCENPAEGKHSLGIELPSGEKITVGINIRPYAIECLTILSKKFEIIIFTASHKCYADVVLDLLDPNHEIIHHRLYRENCMFVDGAFIKDLRIITNRNLDSMAIVDNAAYCFAYQLENGIPIVSWYNDDHDTELVDLTHFLSSIAGAKDLRESIRNTFHLEQLSNNTHTILGKM